MTKPQPPYYAVLFTSELGSRAEGYEQMATRMVERARSQPGFLGFDSARGEDGRGVTVSYWSSLEAIHAWKSDREHAEAQARGNNEWYKGYRIRIAQVLDDREGPDRG